ncbi:MAG: glycosyltransferase family 2 protein [Candidatus Omnitrophica bacterium]|nr:glycosyltransferase family 2 protein [Candidatus Omnitrophota bacterium]
MDSSPLVDIVILNLNQERDTIECIESLKNMHYKNYRILLIDNGSTDGSGVRVKERFKDIEFLRSEENLGFAWGCNLGIKYFLKDGLADYVLLLNNDTKVSEDLLDALLEVGEADKRIGIVGAVNFYYSHPERIHLAGHKFIWWLGIQGVLEKISSKSKEVQGVSGCCMLIKKEVIEKIGFLDERFFSYYEDTDFCLRAKRRGFKVVVARDAKVWHKITKMFGAKTPQTYYIYTRNQPLFMLKNCPIVFLPNYFMVYFLKVFIRIIYFYIVGKRDVAIKILNGFVDFFQCKFGKGRLFD